MRTACTLLLIGLAVDAFALAALLIAHAVIKWHLIVRNGHPTRPAPHWITHAPK